MRLRIGYLFPELLSVYGDDGNVTALAARSRWRGIDVTVDEVPVDARRLPDADLYLIGGGQDREQALVAHALVGLGPELDDRIGRGAALLAVCAGFQNLGRGYLTGDGRELPGPGIFEARTTASPDGERLVGPALGSLADELVPLLAVAAPASPVPMTVVGFENHAGRTALAPGARPLATLRVGGGNDGRGAEGYLALPGEGGRRGLRVGTYLHGPLLPRNPHVADLVIASALGLGAPVELGALPDAVEWRAHDAMARRALEPSRPRLSGPLAAIRPLRSLIGF